MFKKSMATALLVLTIPALASASWFLTTQVTSPGGTITSVNKTGQTQLDGALSTSHVSAATDPGDTLSYEGFNHNTGYNPQKVVLTDTSADGKTATVLYDVNDATHQSFPASYPLVAQDGHSYNLTASFIASALSLKAGFTNAAAGTASPASVGSIYYNYKLTTPMVFVFSPKSGYTIKSIAGTASLPAGSTVKPDVNNGEAAGEGKRVVVTIPASDAVPTYLTAGFNLQAAADITAKSVDQILPRSVTGGSTVTLSGGYQNFSNPTATWSYVSGPANSTAMNLNGSGQLDSSSGSAYTTVPGPVISLFGDKATGSVANGTQVTMPSTKGQYKFLLTVADGTKTLYSLATINVVATATDSGASQCTFCHSANNIPAVADTGTHQTCQSCHFGGSGHPGSVNAGTVNATTFVVAVDNVANGIGGPAAKGTNFCASCHGVVGNAAQAIPAVQTHQNKLCSDCHTSAHETHVASANCQVCHATVDEHTAANVGTKGCTDCHDGHNPTVGTKPFLVAAGTHPPVTLYTFEEIGYQMNNGQPVPVQVDANGKGFPYSPKQTCGTSGCHVINGIDYTYDKISDHAFHSAQGRNEMSDTANGRFDTTKNKPWLQSTAMVGKW